MSEKRLITADKNKSANQGGNYTADELLFKLNFTPGIDILEN